MKNLALIRRRHDHTRDAFREHYESGHAPLALPLLRGLERYERSHVRDELFGRPGFDVVTWFWWRDVQSALAVMALRDSPAGEEIRADELSFMDVPANTNFALEERVLREPAPSAACLIALVKRPDGEDREGFHLYYEKEAIPELLDAVDGIGGCEHHRAIVFGEQEPRYDAVTRLGVERAAGAAEWAAAWAARGARVVLVQTIEHRSEMPVD